MPTKRRVCTIAMLVVSSAFGGGCGAASDDAAFEESGADDAPMGSDGGDVDDGAGSSAPADTEGDGSGAPDPSADDGSGDPPSDDTAGADEGGTVPGEVLFFDDFEYVVDRDPSTPADAFVAEGGWNGFKDMRTSENAGGYLYTVDALPGFSGGFPGVESSRVLCVEARGETEAPEVSPGWAQTDFYLQYGDEAASVIGELPPDLWVQFWIYQNDYGDQTSQFDRGDKFLYPTRSIYPAVEGEIDWLLAMGTASLEPHNIELGEVADRFPRLLATGGDFTAATEYPTNQSKLGQNLDVETFIARNTWMLVKMHIDTSAEQGAYEVWMRRVGEPFTKVSEWIGGTTPDFAWPIPEDHRDGHRLLRMPTTMNDYDSWTYLDDFALATSEDALPVYGR